MMALRPFGSRWTRPAQPLLSTSTSPFTWASSRTAPFSAATGSAADCVSSRSPRPHVPAASVTTACPAADLAAFAPHYEVIDLPLRKMLHEKGHPVQQLYFSNGGMFSLLIPLEDGGLVEAGVVGREGFAGLSAIIGAEVAPHSTM